MSVHHVVPMRASSHTAEYWGYRTHLIQFFFSRKCPVLTKNQSSLPNDERPPNLLDKAAQIVERVYGIRFSALCWYLPNRAQLWGRKKKERQDILFQQSSRIIKREKQSSTALMRRILPFCL